MIFRKYLAINSYGTARITKSRPALRYDEICIALELDLPKELFDKPQLSAKVTVPKEAVAAREIEARVVDNIEKAVKSAAGVDVQITLVNDANVEED